ncbi:YeeE/YedE family protein [Corallincola platygyrae]|uniref:YeeE/YedE family protein n=1 Tax=Corallincola platygyrae TaxID=1193278 RepID=A0ABW4XQE1_9GAMM
MIDMANFTPVESVVGGMLIGAGALTLLLCQGRIAGISGIVGGVLSQLWQRAAGELSWRLMFLLGLIIGPLLWFQFDFAPAISPTLQSYSVGWLLAAGLLVGLGTGIGSGCTSGHGICGIGRLSVRSVVATLLFMASAIITLFVVRHLLGGAP